MTMKSSISHLAILAGLSCLATPHAMANPTPASSPSTHAAHHGKVSPAPWWQDAVVYQVYPRSFQDSNGDGIGDLKGLTSRLDYLKQLGINVIWLSPHFDSPNVDNGYDIRDYRKVMREFGTMADFDTMMAQARKRGIKVIIDLVVNHTSDQHQWFVEASKGPGNPYRDYYIWRPARGDGPPNNDPSFFGGSAWSQTEGGKGDYYLHYFAKQQPDLNWDNPKVRSEVYDLMRFWLDKGVAGFRMDVIPFISKDPAFPDLTPAQLANPDRVYANGPRIHTYLQEMNRKVLSRYGAMTVGEAVGVSMAQAPQFVNASRGELNMIFHFDALNIDREGWRTKPWALADFKAIYTRLDQSAGKEGWNTSFLTNHDKPRAVSHFGDDSAAWRVPSAKALATMMLTLRGTPFIYQGDELGMTNYPFRSITEYDDISARNLWQSEVASGKVKAEEFLPQLARTSRDNSRTPMQWSAQPNGGFTTGKPWLAVNPNYATINAQAALADPASVFHHYRRLLALRAKTPALVHGTYTDIDPANPDVFAYTRVLGKARYLVVVNFGRKALQYDLPAGYRVQKPVFTSGETEQALPGATSLQLAPWQASIYAY
jgi:oligo-1,6-glucosidase